MLAAGLVRWLASARSVQSLWAKGLRCCNTKHLKSFASHSAADAPLAPIHPSQQNSTTITVKMTGGQYLEVRGENAVLVGWGLSLSFNDFYDNQVGNLSLQQQEGQKEMTE